jgi:hydroxyacylglutathione hydrolase
MLILPAQPKVVILRMVHSVMVNYNYLVIDEATRDAVVIDPAWEMPKLEAAVDANQVSVKGVLLTHSHPDHVHLAVTASRKWQCPIWMSKPEIAWSGFLADSLAVIDGPELRIGSLTAEVLETPGHTPGCVCFRIGDNLFTGDVLFAEGCGMCPDREAAYAMFKSLEGLKARLDPWARIFPGHSYGKAPGQPFSRVLLENIYLQFEDPGPFADFRLRKRQDMARMFQFS